MSRTSQQENSEPARSRRSRGDMRSREHSTRGALRAYLLPRRLHHSVPSTGGARPGPMTRLFTGALIVAVSFAACRKSLEQEPELEAIDVGPALEIGTEDDQTAVERPAALVGVLPEDFPADLPLYLPASLVDFGTVGDGWVFVNLLTPHPLVRVERELSAQLTRRGWTAATAGSGRLLRKGASRVRLRVEDARPGTQYRFEYPG